MTDLELLKKCIMDLGTINIPMALLEQIGIPVYNVRQSLLELVNAIEIRVKKQNGEADEQDNPEPSEEPHEIEVIDQTEN